MSMPIVTLTSSSNAGVNRASPYNRSGRILRDPSFSSYLNGAEETFVLKLRSTSAREFNTIPHDRILDAEIDVFDAQKYFSQSYDPELDALPSRHGLKKDGHIDTVATRPPLPWVATASIGSESSWNSHCTLLQPRRLKKKTNFLASIGYGCSCRDKNSVSINHFDVKKSNSQPLYLRSDGREMRVHDNVHFSFPVLDKSGDDQKKQMLFRASALPVLENGKYHFSDESDSDASSDLFEIESFSMQASDGCITPQPEYAPSEASIEWSVVTASAADFSALSDTEEVRSNVARSQVEAHRNQKNPKPRPSILSGCRNYKAVNVVGSQRPCNEKARPCDKNNIPGFNRRNNRQPRNGQMLYT